eukprot:3886864-Amphidinium_carterae.1
MSPRHPPFPKPHPTTGVCIAIATMNVSCRLFSDTSIGSYTAHAAGRGLESPTSLQTLQARRLKVPKLIYYALGNSLLNQFP